MCLERLHRTGAGDAHRLLAGAEEGNRGDAHDVERLRDPGVGIDVDLDDIDRALVLGGDLLHLRGDHLARSAPGGPEVNNDRLVVLENELLEGVVRRVLDGHMRCSFLPARARVLLRTIRDDQAPWPARLWMSR